MELARDLGQVDLWEESLRRSLERRNKPRRSSVELQRLRPARDLTLADVIERSSHYSQLRRQAAERPAMPRPSVALTGVSAAAVLAAASVPKLLGGGGNGAHRAPAALSKAASTKQLLAAPKLTGARLSPTPAIESAPAPVQPAVANYASARSTALVSAPVHHHHAAPATSASPEATIASVTHTTVSHASGGAGLTAATRHSAVDPHVTPAHRLAPVHRVLPTRVAAHHKTAVPAVHHKAATPAAHHKVTAQTHGASGGATLHASAPATLAPSGYVNPLADAHLTPERIDQGVDYSGTGTLTALGAGKVVYSSSTGTGWPGAFVEYRLTSGTYAGRYVYYAEGVTPDVHVGETVRAGQAVVTLIPNASSGIEIGWGSGVGSQPLAQAPGQPRSTGVATAAGRSFSALIASLGGPPGILEG